MKKEVILTSIALLSISNGLAQQKRPNILFAIADDISYPYMSAYGTKGVHTPAFDEVARRGVLFENGYVTSPGSSPSRASLLTGRYTWSIEEAGTHGSGFSENLVTYTDILAQSGYHVGYTGKGWSPGVWDLTRELNPAGKEYNDKLHTPPFAGINSYDYYENFKVFMEENNGDRPFCFWYGGKEAHRGYTKDSWKVAGVDPSVIDMPPFLPDTPTTRGDMGDFVVEVEWFDTQLGKMLRYLEEHGELENTLIVVTADNGMPFPNAKASGYDVGTHVPMAICWGDQLKPRTESVKEIVSSIDFAATFLDVAGVEKKAPKEMVSQSMLPWLLGEKGAKLPDHAYYAREGHAYSRHNGLGYPLRALRRGDMLYIYNFKPEREPAGDSILYVYKNDKLTPVIAYADIDGSPSKGEIIKRKDESDIAPFFELATAKRPEELLFNLKNDPQCMHNLADDPAYAKQRKELNKELFKTLRKTKDSRLSDNPDVWDTYPYYGRKRSFTKEDAMKNKPNK